MARWSIPIGLSIVLLCSDLISKYLVQYYLPSMEHSSYSYPYGGIGVFENFLGIEFSISYMTNRGAAWGILDSWQTSLVYMRILIVIGMVTYLFFFNKKKEWILPFTLILTGAIGNIIDYFLYGHVVDMLHFVLWGYDYPVFNIADSIILIGIAWLFLFSFQGRQQQALI